MEGRLIKIDKNGSKHYGVYIPCDRCGGSGTYVWGAMINGNPQYAGTCYKCEGRGKVYRVQIERTPEYQAKLDARRAKKQAERMAGIERTRAEVARREAERKAEEKRAEEEKAAHTYVANIGEKYAASVTYDHYAYYETDFGRVFIHTFRDENGNAIIWKTSSTNLPNISEGDTVQIKGTVKALTEYKGEKQTVLTRCKVTK